MIAYDTLQALQAHRSSAPHANRILCELNYAACLSNALKGKHDDTVSASLTSLASAVEREGVITKAAAAAAEALLLPLQADAKKYRVHCIAHAHIDMNWMWGYQETVSVTVDTFRTVLDLMKEYPHLTFGQSQASTYEIIEKHAPAMLPEICERIREGRWDVSASTWVETDKNMPAGESLARHILYTRRYLSQLLKIPAESLALDFEPDTFGHNVSVPEICAGGGVKYYYHCRGNGESENAYIWRGRAGSDLLVYREAHWYNATIDANMLWDTPLQCEKQGIDCLLNVYGVGDHGGGPTRRDVERLTEMASWPIMPTILFSTYTAFFRELEGYRDRLPVKTGEMNFLFDGCYTSQAKIKMANRLAEARMYESEVLDTEAALAGGESFASSFRKAWCNILFNHFHDILPGSGVADTREYAMGRFQDAMATIGTSANLAMRSLAKQINTTGVSLPDDACSISEGGGAGYAVGYDSHYGMPCSERGMGKNRLLHFFNTTQHDYEGVVTFTVFDWDYDVSLATFTATDGSEAPFTLLSDGKMYWGHQYKIFAMAARVPAFGYASYTLSTKERGAAKIPPLFAERTDDYTDDDIVLENAHMRATFARNTMLLTSLVDKQDGKERLSAPAAAMRLITESAVRGMTSWRVGNYMKVETINETQNIRVSDVRTGGVRQWVTYDCPFATRSHLEVTVSLDEGSSMLQFEVKVDFHEIGTCEGGIPQLNFALPLGYSSSTCRFDVPFGTLDRASLDYDVPASSFGAPLAEDGGRSLMLISDCKYGFRYARNSIALSLIRASYDPDPYPEYGIHHIRLGIGLCHPSEDDIDLYRAKDAFLHPVTHCTANLQQRGGSLPLDGRLLTFEGAIRITALKTAEEGDGTVIRFVCTDKEKGAYRLTFPHTVREAYAVDFNEKVLHPLAVEGSTVCGETVPYAIRTVLVKTAQ
jgi:alpha-mannosidase